jgi:hypothetical protein
MIEQIISIAPDGTIYGLDFKAKGVSLRDFGKTQIERVTSIEWDDNKQRWFIQWTCERHIEERNRTTWTIHEFLDAKTDHVLLRGEKRETDSNCPITFVEYEDANAAEVAVIQSLRKRGKLAA